jgi:hypothetical protein
MGGPSVTLTVTWLDGRQETYRCAEAIAGADGVLRLYQPKYPDTGEPFRAIPLAGVRIWTED